MCVTTDSNWQSRRPYAEPIRGQRLTTAVNALGEEAARDISGVVATPLLEAPAEAAAFFA